MDGWMDGWGDDDGEEKRGGRGDQIGYGDVCLLSRFIFNL